MLEMTLTPLLAVVAPRTLNQSSEIVLQS